MFSGSFGWIYWLYLSAHLLESRRAASISHQTQHIRFDYSSILVNYGRRHLTLCARAPTPPVHHEEHRSYPRDLRLTATLGVDESQILTCREAALVRALPERPIPKNAAREQTFRAHRNHRKRFGGLLGTDGRLPAGRGRADCLAVDR